MTLHHSKHHQTYITNLNNALSTYARAVASADLPAQLALQAAIRFNAGGHLNHSLFWKIMTPAPAAASSGSSSTGSPSAQVDAAVSSRAPTLHAALTARFASIDGFLGAFAAHALAIQGSGWCWLLRDAATGALELASSKDQDLAPGVAEGLKVVVLGLDMWEHAYYLQYWNDKKSYVQAWWSVVDWTEAERRFGAKSAAEVWGELAGLASAVGGGRL